MGYWIQEYPDESSTRTTIGWKGRRYANYQTSRSLFNSNYNRMERRLPTPAKRSSNERHLQPILYAAECLALLPPLSVVEDEAKVTRVLGIDFLRAHQLPPFAFF